MDFFQQWPWLPLALIGSTIFSSISFGICYYHLRYQRLLKENTEQQLEKALQQQFFLQQEFNEIQQKFNNEWQKRLILEEKASRIPHLEYTLETKQRHHIELQTQVSELKERLQQQQSLVQEKLAVLHQAQSSLTDTFKALSAHALEANNQSFLDLAQITLQKFQESAQTDLNHRQGSISEVVKPLKEKLQEFDQKILSLETSRIGAYESLKTQVQELIITQKDLKSETSNLVNALRAPVVRGRWGEMQLRRVAEIAGMIAHCDFTEQSSFNTEDGKIRPDMVIHLPGGKKIIIDSKVPLSAYLEALETKDEQKKMQKLKDHARHVRNHIQSLSSKSYWSQLSDVHVPEFVVLFLPGEIFFSAALEQDPSLIETGAHQQVILATPTTLIALLKAISYSWRQEKLADNARQIAELGKDLYKRLGDLGSHLERLGRHLGIAVDSYNQTVGTLERRVLVSARRFKELGAASDTDLLNDLNALDKIPRTCMRIETDAEENPVPWLKAEVKV